MSAARVVWAGMRKLAPPARLFALTILAACSNSPAGGGDPADAAVDAPARGGAGRPAVPVGGAMGGSGGAGGSDPGGSGGAAPGSPVDAGNRDAAGGGAGSSGDAGGSDGAASPAAAGHTFGARPQAYPAGSIRPTGTQAELDAVVKAAYDRWKAAYVATACGGHVVKSRTPTTTSSALGNGMIITAMMAGHDPQARTVFDGLFAVGRKFASGLSVRVPPKHGIGPRPGNEYLVNYAIDAACMRVSEGDGAGTATPSGDLPFAYALALADRQWGSTGTINYLAEARNTANAIKLYHMNPQKVTGLGDWASLPGEGMWTTVARPNYFMVGYYHAYARASGDPYWMQAVEAVHTRIADVQTRFSPMTGLLPQYLVGGTTPPTGTFLGDANARDYFGGGGLIPLWLASDYIGSGDPRSKVALTRITQWLKSETGGDASKIVDGYRLDGDAVGTTGTMAFVAPFGAIAIFDAANQGWLDAIWKLMSTAPTTSQVADTANLLGMLMVTGNWWQP
jgi:hypothetical protein